MFKKTLRPVMIVSNNPSDDRAMHQRDGDQHGCTDRKDLEQRWIGSDVKDGQPRR